MLLIPALSSFFNVCSSSLSLKALFPPHRPRSAFFLQVLLHSCLHSLTSHTVSSSFPDLCPLLSQFNLFQLSWDKINAAQFKSDQISSQWKIHSAYPDTFKSMHFQSSSLRWNRCRVCLIIRWGYTTTNCLPFFIVDFLQITFWA